MPRTGGESDKLGNRYESLWTVHNLIDVLAGDAAALQPEAYDESIGVEFIKTLRDNHGEFHSVKRQRAGSGWTLSALTSSDQGGRSVLKDLFDKLGKDPTRMVVFVTMTLHSQTYEVWDRSKRCQTPEEFESQLKTDKGLHEDFNKYVLPLCKNDLLIALTRFHSLRLVSQDEYELRRQTETSIRRLLYRIDGQTLDPRAIVLKLGDFIFNSLGRRIVESDIRSELGKHGLHLQDWGRDSHSARQVRALNERYLRHVEGDLILGQFIPRSEAVSVVEALQGNGNKLAHLIVGGAGRGKSCVLTQIVRNLEKSFIPILALRLDNIPAVNNTGSLGETLGLRDSPAIILAGLSQGRRAVLLIDQLDAMSVVSGRNADLWQTFDDLLQEVKQHPNLRLLLACRAFDLEHDPRLAGLVKAEGPAQRIDLALLAIETVQSVVRQAGGSAERLSAQELEILRTPFHLHLFVQGEPTNPIAFGGRQELFNRFWKAKRQKANQKNVNFDHVVGLLTNALSQNESTSVPTNRLDTEHLAASVLVSDNVLVEEAGRYRFFHESFFDYAFARRFVREGRDLIRFLTEECTEQHLFRRAQVRQILAYQREDNLTTYLSSLFGLLNSDRIRIHLKKLALDWLAQLENPTEGEWGVVGKLLKHPKLHWSAFNILWGKLPWFDLLDKLGALPQLLSDQDSRFVDRCIQGLSQQDILKNRSKQMAALLRPFQGRGEVWMRRFREIFRSGHFYHSQEMFDLALDLVDEGLFDDRDQLRWHSLIDMAEQRAQLAVDLLTCVLKRLILQAKERGELNPFEQNELSHQIEPRFIDTAAKNAPLQFSTHILPIIKDLVLSDAHPAKCGGYYDNIWRHISFGREHDTSGALLGSTGRALKLLAVADPKKCELLLSGWQQLEHKTLQFLLIVAWNGNPVYFAETAANHFINYPLAFIVRYDGGIGDTNNLGDANSLLVAIDLLVQADTHAKLESAIYGYKTPYEKQQPKYWGCYELELLRKLKPERLSKKALARIAELEAKFPAEKPSQSKLRLWSRRKQSCFFSSSIPTLAFKKMGKDQLVKLLRDCASGTKKNVNGGTMRRADELYSPLLMAAKADRQYFASLVLILPDDILPNYFDAILDGLVDNSHEMVKGGPDGTADVEVPNTPLLSLQELLQVVQRVHQLPNKPCGKAICRIAGTVANGPMPIELVEIVSYYALHDSDPETEIREKDAVDEATMYGGDPLFDGINSVRGSAAYCFGRFLFAHPEMSDQLIPVVEALAMDRSIAVRAVNVECLLALLNTNKNKAVELFHETCDASEPLWSSRSIENFIYYGTMTHYLALRPLILKMLASSEKASRHAASRQIALAAFRHPEAEADMKIVLSSDEECRRGVAEIYAHNVHNESAREKCVVNLELLFNDPSKVVRDTTINWFFGRNGRWTDWQRSLLRKYVESEAYADGDMRCQMNLKDTAEKLPEEVLRSAERAVELNERQLDQPSRVSTQFAYYLPSLTLRFYEQSSVETTRRKCLDAFDRMIAFGWGEASQELAKTDRW